jgi:hemerythrin-like domain-containing protein
MSGNNSIISLMIRDHCKLEKLIGDLEEKNKGTYEEMKKAFTKFEWELEKHIFTEEKAIFTDYSPEDVSQGYKMLPELTKQHNYIVNTLNNWREDVRKRKMLSDVYSFKEFLLKHREFEEEKVYPELEEALSEEDKRNIIAKINELV